jgi:phage terminase large subunit-like protein
MGVPSGSFSSVARMQAVAAEWHVGDWYVDRNAAWTEAFVEQITLFSNAANDDMVDMMSQAAVWLFKTRGPRLVISHAYSGTIWDGTR